MITDERLLEIKEWLTAEVICDSEEIVEWAIEIVPDLIDELLELRKWKKEVTAPKVRSLATGRG